MKCNTEINLDKHNVFFTADLHLFHDNILWMNKRPFKDCDEMYEYFVKEWNSKVGPDDYVFVLGDVLWGSQASRLKALSEKLNGKSGSNFDCFYSHDRADFIRCKSEKTGTDQLIYMSHYPAISWPNKGRGSIMLHGHVHGSMDDFNEESPDLRVDVGVDARLGYMKLLSFDDIYEYMLHKAGDISLAQYMQNIYDKKEAII